MKLYGFQIAKFQNQEHFQYMTAVRKIVFPLAGEQGMVQGTTHADVSVLTPFKAEFIEKLSMEDLVLVVMAKSFLTDIVTALDARRDNAIANFRSLVSMFKNSADEAEREASRILQIIISTHGDFHRKSYNIQTSSTHNFLQDIDAQPDAIATINGRRWVEEIRESNLEFDKQVHQRYDEKSLKPIDDIKQVRREIDAIYKQMMNMLEIVDKISPSEEITTTIRRLNEVFTEFRNNYATRKGVAKAQKEKEEARKKEQE